MLARYRLAPLPSIDPFRYSFGEHTMLLLHKYGEVALLPLAAEPAEEAPLVPFGLRSARSRNRRW
jgi:hypothetical protein